MPASFININDTRLFIDFSGTVTTGFVPRVADVALSAQCEDCGADMAETMELWSEDDDGKRWIVCGACALQYRLHWVAK